MLRFKVDDKYPAVVRYVLEKRGIYINYIYFITYLLLNQLKKKKDGLCLVQGIFSIFIGGIQDLEKMKY